MCVENACGGTSHLARAYIATIEATASVKVSYNIARNSLDFANSYYHSIDMLKLPVLSKKYITLHGYTLA